MSGPDAGNGKADPRTSHAARPSRTFDIAVQHLFAQLSGDHNPMHVDAVAARRLTLGLVVHGVHAVLWALDAALANHQGPLPGLKSLAVDFRRPIRVGEVVEAAISQSSAAATRIDLLVGGRKCVRMSVAWFEAPSLGGAALDRYPQEDTPLAKSFSEVASAEGTAPLFLKTSAAASLLPNVTRLLPRDQFAGLLAITRVVGMDAPGRDSILAGLDLQFDDQGEPGANGMSYRASSSDERFSLVVLDVRGGSLRGTVKTIVRTPPYHQPAIATLAQYVPADAFAGVRALVVGGSRGLGELAAKAIAAGGGEILLTYRDGADDAADVTDKIREWGGKAGCSHLDVLATDSLPDSVSSFQPNTLLYFASPRIEFTDRNFDNALFHRFIEYYVGGVARLVEALAPSASRPITLWYPSTIFVEQPELGAREYIAAKAAGEALCHYLSKHTPGLRAHIARLPKLLSDQTVGAPGIPSIENHMLLMLEYLSPIMRNAKCEHEKAGC